MTKVYLQKNLKKSDLLLEVSRLPQHSVLLLGYALSSYEYNSKVPQKGLQTFSQPNKGQNCYRRCWRNCCLSFFCCSCKSGFSLYRCIHMCKSQIVQTEPDMFCFFFFYRNRCTCIYFTSADVPFQFWQGRGNIRHVFRNSLQEYRGHTDSTIHWSMTRAFS